MTRNHFLSLVLALIPFCAMCFSVPLWDRTDPFILGLPFNLFWLILWIPLTSLCLWCIYCLRGTAEREGKPAQDTSR